MLFDLPFLLDPEYIGFLEQRAERIFSVHFSLYSNIVQDARHRLESHPPSLLTEGLRSLAGPRKYALANGRFLPPEDYFSREKMSALADLLAGLRRASALDGLVFADPYFLQALSDAAPDLASELEAVPSVNCRIDSMDSFQALLDGLEGTRFRPPGKILLDRGLNRRPEDLDRMVRRVRRVLPEAKIGLLANEGCLYECPFKPAHDAQISWANATGAPIMTHEINRDFGCRRVLGERPHLVLKSPFIRPEDVGRYEPFVDFIKICGRTLGGKFLTRTASAYLDGFFDGNLLELLDASHWMAGHLDLPNYKLPLEFYDRVVACDRRCEPCGWCREVFDGLVTRLGPGLAAMDDAGSGTKTTGRR